MKLGNYEYDKCTDAEVPAGLIFVRSSLDSFGTEQVEYGAPIAERCVRGAPFSRICDPIHSPNPVYIYMRRKDIPRAI